MKPALDRTRIGELVTETPSIVADLSSEHPYKNEPERDSSLLLELIPKPYAAETYPSALNTYLTDASALYVRNHAPVPTIDDSSHIVVFQGGLDGDKSIPLEQLIKSHKKAEVTSVLQCAGNRASQDKIATGENGFKDTPFENLNIGMMGNVRWGGIALSDVVQNIFEKECEEEKSSSDKPRWHVNFVGADGYETSVPLAHIMNPLNDSLLAIEMNGHKLTPDHGFPLRVILPGIVGARQVKWVESISLSRDESKSPWSAHYYRDSHGVSIQQLPMQSIILSPSNSSDLSTSDYNSFRVEGVAYSGSSGADIVKVDISIDDGATWTEAELLHQERERPKSLHSKCFDWVRFLADVRIQKRPGQILCIQCRATDSTGNTQPKISVKQRGYIFSGWHKVNIRLK